MYKGDVKTMGAVSKFQTMKKKEVREERITPCFHELINTSFREWEVQEEIRKRREIESAASSQREKTANSELKS